MVKKIAFIILILAIGFTLSMLLDSFLRRQVIDLYKWTTNNKTIFTGKNFHFFPSTIHCISFTLSFAILGFSNMNQTIRKILINTILWIFIFTILIISLSAFDANMKIVECTACEYGIRKLHYNDVNYGLIIGVASILSSIPSCVNLIKQRKQ